MQAFVNHLKKNQLVTAQGALGLETYGDNPMIRLDFASILNYGYTPEEQTKTAFIPIDLDNVKSTTEAIKTKKVTIKA